MGFMVKLLHECSIIAQYTIPDTPEQNGLAEKRIRTFKDMVWTILSDLALAEGQRHKMAMHI